MIIQRALASRNMTNICDHKYIKMAYEVENLNPQLEQILKLLGCKNREYDSSTINPDSKFSKPSKKGFPTTTPIFSDDDKNEEESSNTGEDNLESGYPPPEKESKIQQLLSIARGEKKFS